jgi:hypothetical protein
MPLIDTPLNKTFPVLCCLCGGERKKDKDIEQAELETKEHAIDVRNERLIEVIKFFKGKY